MKYNLNWDAYSDHLREKLNEMLKTNELTDVTLVCDDKKQFKAHRIILSACSEVFKSIIHHLPLNSSVIYLKGIQHQEMQSILEFLYLGEATLDEERMTEFLNVAKNLEIKEIGKIDAGFDDKNASLYDEPEMSAYHIDEDTGPVYDNPPDLKVYQKNVDTKANIEADSDEHSPVKQLTPSQEIKDSSNESKIDEEKFSCNQCANQFASKSGLRTHIKSIHDGARYECKLCDEQYNIRSSLRRHVLSKHQGVKFSCNECVYQATQKTHLRRHIQSYH